MSSKELGLLSIAGGLLVWGFGLNGDSIAKELEHWIPYKGLLSLVLIILLFLGYVLFLLWRQHNTQQERKLPEPQQTQQIHEPSHNLTIKNGIYYDKDDNAFCPTCKTLMSHQLPSYYDDNYWWCNPCKKYYVINPTDEDREIELPFTIGNSDKYDGYL